MIGPLVSTWPLSFLPLRRVWRIPWFLAQTLEITRRLARSPGLVGYFLYARPLAKEFWTLSVWTDEDDRALLARAGRSTGRSSAVAAASSESAIMRLWRDRFVQRLIRINGLKEAFADRLAPALRAKFLELLRESRLERDLE